MRLLTAALALTLAGAAPVRSSAQAADTTAGSSKPLFTSRDAAIFGSFGVATAVIAPADRHFAERLQHPAIQENRLFSGTARIVTWFVQPGAPIIGVLLYAGGRAADNGRMTQLGLYGAEAIGLGVGVNYVTKVLAGRARPYVSRDTNPRDFGIGRGLLHEQYRSFPSGHTVTAFAAASAVTKMTAEWWPHAVWYVAPVMYGGASVAGLSRMFNNKHWASDVIVGAAIGTFSGLKVVQYNISHPDNRVDRWLLAGSLRGTGRGAALRVMILPY